MKRFKNIVCGIEPGEQNDIALERAVALAENNQASLTVIDVVGRMKAGIGMPDGGPIAQQLQEQLEAERQKQLDALTEPYRERIDIKTEILRGTSFLELIRDVIRNDHDLLIKVPENPEWFDKLFGSDDMHLLRKCPCPVWLVKADAPKSFKRVLAAVDVDETGPEQQVKDIQSLNRKIIEIASSIAIADFSELHVVNVYDAVGESAMRGAFLRKSEEQIDQYVDTVRSQHKKRVDQLMSDAAQYIGAEAMGYLKPEMHLIKGWARKEIPRLSKDLQADLVVMGTVARTGIPGFFMGNTAETILNQINCSVLALKPESFVTPVTLED
jgi:nucleotide-binding universal stress UspA family protein